MNRTKIVKLVAPLLALGMALTACGGGDSTSAASGDHNDQDVTFATEMIPHHAQAVQMAEMALANAESQDVKDLAEDISAAQGPEIEQMSSWLETWGEDVPDTDGGGMGGMDHGGTDGMPGMMSSGQMDELDSASGSAFDEMFLSMMIEHHEGAIEMAQTEQADGESPDAIDLAETIEETQAAEIETMKAILESQ
ncbi:Uncharacterized conserved protein, DUF305 family [Nocardioides alpinus]|uniref:DUF305 domain-containing protein n=1 Tax=Nocardioides alpinus TaxID=748909 RepID=A0A1I1AJ44_9ACTN|nr:DUF305 domain-containing protein [Nocardioides alpinus]PKH41765.1 DUF305 domain-containing protein [Nocardioides alpinus]SFB38051.1 Uncharacterized conserved protein, DUF305 family [Nocardioides alpinus]